MLISYKWLQSYFDKKLPPPEKLAERVTFAFAEVESVEKKGGDTVLDIKVLPDRACYALSHRGLAREVSAMLNIPLKEMEEPSITESAIPDPSIGIDEPKLCTKFVARRIENIKVGPSPARLRESLETIGQRSINNIVDATNFVMFDIGRPSHAFDADKVKGKLTVRSAKRGERVVLLDGKEIELKHGELVMADDKGPVGLAGIKGGKRTEVDANTTNIILEAANWNPSYIRLTAASAGIKTEASRRFENRISPLLGEEGIDAVTRLIAEIAKTPEMKVGKRIALSFEKPEQRKLAVDPKRISQKLGIPVSEKAVVDALARLGIVCESTNDRLVATIPYERLDLTIPEDIAEEVGRIIGYDKIPAILPPKSGKAIEVPKAFYYEWKVREALVNAGFSEVMTSSFMPHGDIEIEKPLAEDKRYARSELWHGFDNALMANNLNSPLFGSSEMRQFEIGKVFTTQGEHTALAIGVVSKNSAKKTISDTVSGIEELLGIKLGGKMEGGQNVYECNLDKAIEKLPELKEWNISVPDTRAEKFTPFSLYPFIVRDVALFVSPETTPESVWKIIKENAGELVVRGPELFDEFSKDGKKSLAFRLIFQSFDRTLSDEEVNKCMEKVYVALKANGWEVR